MAREVRLSFSADCGVARRTAGGRAGRIDAAAPSRTPCPNHISAFEKALKSYADNPTENVITPVLGTTFDCLGEPTELNAGPSLLAHGVGHLEAEHRGVEARSTDGEAPWSF